MEEFSNETNTELRVDNTREFLIGCAITFFTFVAFTVAQSAVLIHAWSVAQGVDFSAFSLSAMQDGEMQQQLTALSTDGDTIARVSLWSGLVCSLIVIFLVYLWKRVRWNEVFGFRAFSIKNFFIFLGLFFAAGLIQQFAMEAAGIESEFMVKVMGKRNQQVDATHRCWHFGTCI